MKVFWSDFAIEMLKEVYVYYHEVAGKRIAKRIKADIFSATRQLTKHPESGPIEDNLVELNEGHRYLIRGHYKIIYKRIKEGILITDIFDTRQDPIKMNEPQRKPC